MWTVDGPRFGGWGLGVGGWGLGVGGLGIGVLRLVYVVTCDRRMLTRTRWSRRFATGLVLGGWGLGFGVWGLGFGVQGNIILRIHRRKKVEKDEDFIRCQPTLNPTSLKAAFRF